MLHVSPTTLNVADECRKALNSLQREKDKVAATAFKVANIDPRAHDFAVLVGALLAAVASSDADAIEKFKLMGDAAIKGLLPFEAQPVSGAQTTIPTAPRATEPQEANSAITTTDTAPGKAQESAELAGGAADLIAIVPQRLEPGDADAMREIGFVCNTDTRRKKDVVYIWQGHGAPDRVEAIVSRYGATINKVTLPAPGQFGHLADNAVETSNLPGVAPIDFVDTKTSQDEGEANSPDTEVNVVTKASGISDLIVLAESQETPS